MSQRPSGVNLIRGIVTVTVEFQRPRRLGPLAERVASVAKVDALDGRRFCATFDLDNRHLGFGTLASLLQIVGGKRSTVIEVDGYPELSAVVQAMARCARPFAYSSGLCGFHYTQAVPDRCRACPLFDEERAQTLIAEYAKEASAQLSER